MDRCKICDSSKTTVKLSFDLDGISATVTFCFDCAHKFEMDVSALERKGLPEYLARCKAFAEMSNPSEPHSLCCPNCGLDAHDVLANGKAGCAFCYIVFNDLPVHKAAMPDRHIDALVSQTLRSGHESTEILERLLQEAVSAEDYEKAARLRDRLRNADPSLRDS